MLLILKIEINVSFIHILERLIKASKNYFLTHLNPVQGYWWLPQQLRVQGGTQFWTAHPSVTGSIHIYALMHSDWDSLLKCTSLGHGRKRSTQRKTTLTWGDCKAHRLWLQLELMLFFSSRHHNETMLNKMILLEDLLYIRYFATLMVSFPLSFYLLSFL